MKKAADRPLFSLFPSLELAGGNSFYRAGINACPAVRAGVCVDDEQVVALADRFHRTGGLAGAAGNTFA